ncbi:VWA domain-containing protein [Cellulomonas sp. P22]|uniref:VWA domain-containing protein n=1 Tax=Cellulomonas sp. P22 TaxID=3373189 RepID=UPI0037BF2A45
MEAAELPDDLAESVVAGQGFDTRLAALTQLADLMGATGDAAVQASLETALEQFKTATQYVSGDSAQDVQLFESDMQALATLASISDASVAASIAQITNEIVEADRIAAVHEWQLGTTLSESGSCGAPDRCADALRHFRLKYAEGIDLVERGAIRESLDRFRDAWRPISQRIDSFLQNADNDRDLIPRSIENQLGLDAGRADTDGDGLADSIELFRTMTDPTLTATDGVTRDGDADGDGDSVTNARELVLGTDPANPDTDGDGLTDGQEAPTAFDSDPTLADTDADGLDDASEQRLGTNPRNADTDGDGTPDGQETYTSSIDAASLGVEGASLTVAMTGVGDVAATVLASDESQAVDWDGAQSLLSKPIDLRTDTPFDSAQLTFGFDPNAVPDGDFGHVAIGYLDVQTGMLTPIETTVDAASGTATATSTHFTTFVLFYVPKWQAVMLAEDPRGDGGGDGTANVDVMLVLDSSGSMSSNDPTGLRRTSAQRFIDALIAGDRAGVVSFASSASLLSPLTEDLASARAAVSRVGASGGTDIGAGVSAAHSELLNNATPDRARIEIVLTDGQGSYDSTLTTTAVQNDITVYTIGLGSAPSASLLRGIADATGGQYFAVAQAADLPNVFSRIADDVGAGTDTDRDGLYDTWELNGMPTGTGVMIRSDPTLADSDGDGLLDGEEMQPYQYYGGTLFRMVSHPYRADSDGDGLADAEEIDLGTNPLNKDMDRDGVNDGDEYTYGWDPALANSDGDSFNDGAELAHDLDPFTYDATLLEQARAFLVGAVLGEVGYALADQGVSGSTKVGWTTIGGRPYPIADIGFVKPCSLPGATCVEVAFSPMLTEQVTYVVGMTVVSFIPVADVVVSVRDVIGLIMQGDTVGAIIEAALGVVGLAEWVGDVPGVIADVTRWARHGKNYQRMIDEALTSFARMADDAASARSASVTVSAAGGSIADDAFSASVRAFRGSQHAVLTQHLADADLRKLAAGRRGARSLDDLANALSKADSVRSAGKWFDDPVPTGLGFGRQAEQHLQSLFSGVGKRINVSIGGKTEARFIDSFSDVGGTRIARESKTGDGKLSSFVRRQVEKDKKMLADAQVADVEWHFFASGRGNSFGPDPALIDLLQAGPNPITVVIWNP